MRNVVVVVPGTGSRKTVEHCGGCGHLLFPPLQHGTSFRVRPMRLVDSLLDMSLSQAAREALTQMLETQPNLDRWRLRARTVEEPETGSDLALDDRIFPHMAISQLARMSLVLSGEHLRLRSMRCRSSSCTPRRTSLCCAAR